MRRSFPALLALSSLCVALTGLAAARVRAADLAPGDVLAVDETGHRLTRVRPADGQRAVLTTIPLPAGARDATLGRDGALYLTVGPPDHGIVRIAPGDGAWAWLVAPGVLAAPHALAADMDGALLVVDGWAPATRLVRVSVPDGSVSDVIPPGALPDMRGVAVRPDGTLLLSRPGSIVRWSRATSSASPFATGSDLATATQLLLSPLADRLYVAAYGPTLDMGVFLVLDGATGARLARNGSLNVLTDLAALGDGDVVLSDGGSGLGRMTPGGTWSSLVRWQPGDPFDPDGRISYTGIAVVDGPTPAAAGSWGRIKSLYRH